MNLSICSWNIHLGKQLPNITNQISKNPIFHTLDICMLQEASVHNNVSDAHVIASKLGNHFKAFQFSSHILHNHEQANAIIWNNEKIENIKIETVLLPKISDTQLGWFETNILYKFNVQQRNSIVFEGIYNKKSLRIYATHFDILGLSGLHNAQLQFIINDNNNRKPVDLTIIGGDFNTFSFLNLPIWKKFNNLIIDNNFIDTSPKTPSTFRTIPGQHLDRILYKGNYSFNLQVSKIEGSDHYPIFCKLQDRH